MSVNIKSLNENNLDYYFYQPEVINSDIVILNQKVDTLKIHLYADHALNEKEITTYNNTIDDFIEIKKEAQNLNATNQDLRVVKTQINNISFNVKAQSAKGFSVILENQDITLILRRITDKQTNPIQKIEFRARYLHEYGYKKCLEQTLTLIDSILPKYKIKVSELHLATDIQGYDFTRMDHDRIRCRNRTKRGFEDTERELIDTGSIFNSMRFGKGDFMLRIYNKTKEINNNLSAGYVKFGWEANDLYDPKKDVWRIEYQFRRDYLKTLIGKDGLLDGFEVVLNSIPDLWAHGMERFVHHDLTEEQCEDMYRGYIKLKSGGRKILSKHAINKRFQRVGITDLWKKISTFNNFESKPISKYKNTTSPERQYFANCFKGVLTMGTKLLKGDWDSNMIAEMIVTIDKEEIEKKGFSLLDSAKLKAVDYMNDMRLEYHNYGVVKDGYDLYKENLKQSLLKTLQSITDGDYRDRFFEECLKRGQMVYGYRHNNKDINNEIINSNSRT